MQSDFRKSGRILYSLILILFMIGPHMFESCTWIFTTSITYSLSSNLEGLTFQSNINFLFRFTEYFFLYTHLLFPIENDPTDIGIKIELNSNKSRHDGTSRKGYKGEIDVKVCIVKFYCISYSRFSSAGRASD